MSGTVRGGVFSERVATLFATKVITFGIAFFNGILLARLLGPGGKGDYYLLMLLPTTIMILVQLGLPQAFGFFAARGQTRGIVAMTLVLTTILSAAGIVAAIALYPFLREAFLRGLEPALIALGLLSLPLALNATFTSGILLARQAVRWYATVTIAQAIAAAVLLTLMVGVLGLGVPGALAAYLAYQSIQTIAFIAGAARVSAAAPHPERVSYREVLRYGLPLYPASITQFFAYRADVFLLAWLIADASVALGYYSMAVTMAELVFFFPNSVSLVFFPHVAGSSSEQSNRQVPMVSRVTLLVTASMALALVPAATGLIWVVLPAFVPSLPALFVLLPGVVALSVTKVLSDYLAGLGRTAVTSWITVGAFALNIAANLILIPAYGIVGAAAASLLSYSASSLAFSLVAARVSRAPLVAFWIPRRADLLFAATTTVAVGRRMLGRGAARA
jgi:O-antigen/teichoic acid export membrane protein